MSNANAAVCCDSDETCDKQANAEAHSVQVFLLWVGWELQTLKKTISTLSFPTRCFC